jgi:hypothetical protein
LQQWLQLYKSHLHLKLCAAIVKKLVDNKNGVDNEEKEEDNEDNMQQN